MTTWRNSETLENVANAGDDSLSFPPGFSASAGDLIKRLLTPVRISFGVLKGEQHLTTGNTGSSKETVGAASVAPPMAQSSIAERKRQQTHDDEDEGG